MTEKAEKILAELSKLLPLGANGEIADKAGVTPTWVSGVRRAKKESRPVLVVIAEFAVENGPKMEKLGKELLSELEAAA